MKKQSRVISVTVKFICISLIIMGCQYKSRLVSKNLNKLDEYNVIWETPSKDCHGSMPIGNGDIGLNVWTEENGDICFYISKTDSWGDNGRLLKIGKVRVKCEPAIISPGSQFKQELDLKTGTIIIRSDGKYKEDDIHLKFKIWVDAHNPVIYLNHESSIPVKMTASVEPWRNKPYKLKEAVFSDLMQSHTNLKEFRDTVIVTPDVFEKESENEVIWYHHNAKANGFDYVNKLQGASEYIKSNPIANRTFGALLKGTSSKRINEKSITTSSEKSGYLSVFVLTKHPSSPDEWIRDIKKMNAKIETTPYEKQEKAHQKWWNNFWDRSWIFASTNDSISSPSENDDAFIVSRAYALQRFINACAGRGKYPIKFNGSIFTVPPKSADHSEDPDYRKWGPGYWWQNTRLPYLSMCASGDFEMLQPLFKMYGEDIFELRKQITRKYFGFEGTYYPECMYFWGSQFPIDYGPEPWEKRADKLQVSGYHKWEWVAGPELVFMMLNYYDYTQDQKFLNDKIVPITNEIIRFFDNYYNTNDSGKLVMYPSQALETWWDSTNPMPEVAGLHGIIKRLLALPKNITNKQDRYSWNKFYAKLPEIPTHETSFGTTLAPASRFEQKRNIENPELYAVFPFRHFAVGTPNLEWGINALKNRGDKGNFGWRQDDVFMAYLGLTEQAREYLVGRSRSYDKNERFPAFWGPNYDWTPDQDHGGILMKTFQSMLLQVDPYSRQIYLMPAWPNDWNADFKLHAPYNTVLEGKIKNGKIEALKITPSSREKDIVMIN